MRRGLGRLLGALPYPLALLLCAAGLTHLALVLAAPGHSPEDAYARLLRAAAGAAPLATVAAPDTGFPAGDPALASSFCLVDLGGGPVLAELPAPGAAFAALSVYDRHGAVLAGLTNRAAQAGRLAVLLTPAGREPAPAGDPATAGALRVESLDRLGVVRASVLAVSPSARAGAEAMAARLACRALGGAPA